MKHNQYYIDNVKLFVNEFFPGTPNVLITGSFNTPYFNEKSDIDIVLISTWHRDSFVESYNYNNLKVQTIILPFYDIDGVLYRDVAKGKGAIISMLAKGVIIRDQNNLLKRLQHECKVLYERGPMQMQEEYINFLRARITTSIEDIEGSNDFEEQVFTVLNSYNNILKLFTYKKRLWDHEGKSASREIKFKDEKFHKQYIYSLESFFKYHNKVDSLAFLRETLLNCGGELHFTSTRNIKETCEGNRLIIYIQPFSKDTEYKDINTLKKAFCVFLYKHIKDFKCVSFLYPANGTYPSGAYIIIEAKHYQIEEYILPKVELFHLKKVESINSGLVNNWQYPFNINPLETFGTNDIQTKIFMYLSYVNQIYIKETLNNSLEDDTQKVIFIFKHYACLSSLQGDNSWTVFWNMIFDIYIKTHINKMLPTSNLEYIAELKRNSIFKKYKSLREFNKNIPLQKELSNLLVDIEEYYMQNEGVLVTATYTQPYTTKKEQLFYIFFKLIDLTLNVFSIDEKAFVAYYTMKSKEVL